MMTLNRIAVIYIDININCYKLSACQQPEVPKNLPEPKHVSHQYLFIGSTKVTFSNTLDSKIKQCGKGCSKKRYWSNWTFFNQPLFPRLYLKPLLRHCIYQAKPKVKTFGPSCFLALL